MGILKLSSTKGQSSTKYSNFSTNVPTILHKKLSSPNKPHNLQTHMQIERQNKANQVADLNALLRKVFAGACFHDSNSQSVAERFHCALHGNNSPRAFRRNVQVVSDGTSSHLQHVVWRSFVKKDLTQSWKKCSWRTAVEKAYKLNA